MKTRAQLDLTPALARLGRSRPAAQEAANPANLANGPALGKAPLRIQGEWDAVLLRRGAELACISLLTAGSPTGMGPASRWVVPKSCSRLRAPRLPPLRCMGTWRHQHCLRLTCSVLPLTQTAADVQLVVVGSTGNPLASFKLGKVLLSSAWLNPVGGRLAITQLQAETRA